MPKSPVKSCHTIIGPYNQKEISLKMNNDCEMIVSEQGPTHTPENEASLSLVGQSYDFWRA